MHVLTTAPFLPQGGFGAALVSAHACAHYGVLPSPRRLQSRSGERPTKSLPRAYQEPTTFHTTSVIATDEAS